MSKKSKSAVVTKCMMALNRATTKSGKKVLMGVRTGHIVKQTLRNFYDWSKKSGLNLESMKQLDKKMAEDFLQHRLEQGMSASTIKSDRESLEKVLRYVSKQFDDKEQLEKLETKARQYEHINRAAPLTAEARSSIFQRLDSYGAAERDYLLATRIVEATGIRASEVATLRPVGEGKPADDRRESKPETAMYTPFKFTGREENEIWLVTGKGGLTREIALPVALADELRNGNHCIVGHKEKIDGRSVWRYNDLPSGNALSKAFSVCAHEILGREADGIGIHGLRYAYSQERMSDLRETGFQTEHAQGVVSQELGHFRPDITSVYIKD